MKNKLIRLSGCIYILLLFQISACKKEDIKVNTSSIKYKLINQKITANSNSTDIDIYFDLDNDNTDDFIIHFFKRYTNADDIYYVATLLPAPSLSNSFATYGYESDRLKYAFQYNLNEMIDSTTSSYNTVALYRYEKTATTSSRKGIVGVGNTYIGFVWTKDNQKYYGWMQLNCSTDFTTITLIDLAYNSTPNQLIKIGQVN